MLSKLLRLFALDIESTTLTKEQESDILNRIEIINFRRMKIFLFLLLIVEALFILFNDIPNVLLTGTKVIWNDKRFFVVHLLLLTTAFIGIVIIKKITQNHNKNLAKLQHKVVLMLTMIILILTSMLSGLDQIKSGNTTSVFIANTIILSSCILINFPVSFFIYLVPFLTYFCLLFIFQKNAGILATEVINGTIVFFGVLVISKTLYNSTFNVMCKNVTLEEANEKLNYMSNHDPLTGLANRRNFEILASKKMDVVNQNGEEAALILVDIDYFKKINDTLSHPIGDKILKEISSILLSNTKPDALITRWGGEEFLIFIPQVSISEANDMAQKIRIAIEKNIFIIDEFKINMTASFGVSVFKGNFKDSFELSYKLVDKALYQAKNQGRNQVVSADIHS